MSDGVTEKVNMGPLSDLGLNIESCKLANLLALRTRYEYKGSLRSEQSHIYHASKKSF